MSYAANDVITAARLRINDVDGVEYTDAELIEYLNRAMDYVVQVAVLAGGRALEAVVDIAVNHASADLPEDFLSLVSVRDADSGEPLAPAASSAIDPAHYRIAGGKIHAGAATVSLTYLANPPMIDGLVDPVSLPGATRSLVTELTVFAAKNRNMQETAYEERMAAVFESRLTALLAPASSGLCRPMPFMV